MKKSWFITGTDTGVGKTAVSAALARGFVREGLKVGVMKPLESGCELRDGVLVGHDALALREAAASEAPLELINPYSFVPPISPELGARNTGVEIDFKVIRDAFQEISSQSDLVIVEGAGGLLVPLGEGAGGVGMGGQGVDGGMLGGSRGKNRFIADLAAYLDLPLIIVAPSRIGVINQCMLTVSAAREKGLGIAGIVLNHPVLPDPLDRSLSSNALEVQRHTGVELLGEVPYKKPCKENNAPYVNVRGIIRGLLKGG